MNINLGALLIVIQKNALVILFKIGIIIDKLTLRIYFYCVVIFIQFLYFYIFIYENSFYINLIRVDFVEYIINNYFWIFFVTEILSCCT